MANGSLLLQSNNHIKEIGTTTNASNGGNVYLRDLTTSVGSSDFTVEAWVYLLNYSSINVVLTKDSLAGGASTFFGVQTNGRMYFGSSVVDYGGDVKQVLVPLNTWCHLAYVRKNGILTMYCNGEPGTPISLALDLIDYAELRIGRGRGSATTNNLAGYISNVRLIVDDTVYDADDLILIPSSTLTAVSGTTILTGQNYSIQDNSSNNFTLQSSGIITPSIFNPFTSTTTTPTTYSAYFDGSTAVGSYLRSPTTAEVAPTADFTIELWFYPQRFTSINGGSLGLVFIGNSGSNDGRLQIAINATNVILYMRNNTPVDVLGASGHTVPHGGAITLNTWHHLAVTRSGSVYTIYLNGISLGTKSSATAMTYALNRCDIGFTRENNLIQYFDGYISNFRLVKGTAVYTSNFTVPTTPLTAVTNTTLLTLQNNTLVDNSANNFALTAAGEVPPIPDTKNPLDAEQTTTSYSGYFDGTNDYLTTPSNAAFTLGTADFTIECWFNRTGSNSGSSILFDLRTAEPSIAPNLYIHGSGGITPLQLEYYVNGTARIITTVAPNANTWYHVAVVRLSGVTKMYLNGTQVGSSYTDSNDYVGNIATVGGRFAAVSGDFRAWFGYISNARIVKGTAVYTGNFTPSTTPLTAIANTSLLTLQSPTFVDNSTNNFTITNSGNTLVQTFNPFNTVLTTSYSGYFDGSGDYLTVADTSITNFGTSDFTIEAWIYVNSLTANGSIINNTNASTNLNYFTFALLSASQQIHFQIRDASGQDFVYGPGTIPLTTWTHIAVTKQSGVVTVFVNGQPGTPVASTKTITARSTIIGGFLFTGAENYVHGNISNLRVVKGQALYTGSFTPSNTPLTAITNTSLLTLNSPQFTDSSVNNTAITATGNASVQPFSPFATTGAFGNYSLLFRNIGNLAAPINSTITNLSVTGFTLECFAYIFDLSNDRGLFFIGNSINSDDNRIQTIISSAGSINLYAQAGTTANVLTTLSLPGVIVAKQWHHIVITYSGDNSGREAKIFVNGTLVARDIATQAIGSPTNLYIGTARSSATIRRLNGYISNFRLVNNTNVYNVNYSTGRIPTQALQKLSNTETVVGGSVGLGGTTTSFVEVINNTGLNLAGSAYTLELWVYPTATGTERRIVNKNASTTFGYTLLLTAADVVTFRTDNTTITSTATAPINKWTHIAVTNDGTTTRLFVNGVLTNSVTGVTIANEAVNLRIGNRLSDGTLGFNGYIHSLRIVKGTAVYTTAFTKPTAPLTAINGTSLLLFTDSSAGILDESNNCNILTTDTNTQKTNFSPFMPKTRLLMLTEYENVGRPSTEGIIQTEALSTSTLFAGTATSYLEVQNNDGLNLSGSQYTIEMWVYPTGLGTAERRLLNKNPASTFGYMVVLSNTGVVQFRTDSTNMSTGTLTAPLNTWTHIAVTNDGTVTRIFVNGQLSLAATGVTISNESVNLRIGNRLYDGSAPYQGYMSNVRIVKGTALYRKTFTPSTQPLTVTNETSLLACSGATTTYVPRFRDISANAFAPTITGNTTTTMFSPFTPGYYSNNFGGHLTVTDSSELQLAGSQYTIEMWVYPTGSTGTQRKLLNKNGASTFGYSLEIAATSNIVQFFTDNTNINTGTLTAPLNTWTHIAVTNDGTTTRLFVNGQLSASATGVTISNESVNLRIGARLSDATGAFAGNISNVRIVKGTALYTSAFTPSTTPLTAVSGTSLLTCRSANAFEDISTFAHTITASASVSVSDLEPFPTPSSYAVLGSGYFDGTGDYASFADNTLLDMEASNFTIECWVYPQGTALSGLFSKKSTATTSFGGVNVDLTNGVTPQLLVTVNSTTWGINTASTISLNANRWNHVAVVRNGSTWQLFVNGQVGITATLAGTVPNNTPVFMIGARAADGSGTFTGSISNFRVIKGTAVYTAAFTPNFTTPLTATTDTNLLTLTASGVNLDSSAKNYIYTANTTAPSTTSTLHPWYDSTYINPVQHDRSFKDYSAFNRQGILASNEDTIMVYKNPFDDQTLQNQELDQNSSSDVDTFVTKNSLSVAKYLTITTSDALNDRSVISPEQELQTIYNNA